MLDSSIWLPLILLFLARAVRARHFEQALVHSSIAGVALGVAVGRRIVPPLDEAGLSEAPPQAIEHLFIDIPDDFMGVVTEKLSLRQGRMINMVNHGTGRIRLRLRHTGGQWRCEYSMWNSDLPQQSGDE